MRKQKWPIWIIIAIGFLLIVFLFETKEQKSKGPTLVIGGGPEGSTSQNMAEELAMILNHWNLPVQFRARQTAGSLENLIGIEKGKLDFGLANAEDSYLRLAENLDVAKQAVLMVRLFGSYVQLVVPKSSPVKTPADLQGKRVAIGSPGSDSAIIAKRYLQAMSIWPRITPIYVGYDLALEELINGSVEAVWIMAGFPSEAVREANRTHPLRLVSLWDGIPVDPDSRRFYQDFPFYEISVLRPNVYKGQPDTIFTVGMSTLWFVAEDLDEDIVYQALDTVFRGENLARIHDKYPAAQEMSLMNTLTRMPLPMHPGAVRFLRERL